MKLIILLATIALSGCSTSYIRQGDLKAFNSRFIWQTEGFEAHMSTNGASIRLQKSNPDAIMAEAVARGVATGLRLP